MAVTNDAALIIPPPAPAGSAATTNDIRAIKPPVDIPHGAWLWWVLALVVVATAVAVALVWWRRKQTQLPPIPIIPAHVRAKQRLQAALALIHDPRLFCIEVSGVVRLYLEERFEF